MNLKNDLIQDNSKPLDVQQYINVFIRRKWIIILVFLSVFLTTAYFNLKKPVPPPVYRATATIEVEEKRSESNLLPWNYAYRYGSWSNPEGKIMAKLTSFSVCKKVVEILGLYQLVHSRSPGLKFNITPIVRKDLSILGTYTVEFINDGNDFRVFKGDNKTIGVGQTESTFDHAGISFTILNAEAKKGDKFNFSFYPLETAALALRSSITIGSIAQTYKKDDEFIQTKLVKTGYLGKEKVASRFVEDKKGRYGLDPLNRVGILQISVFWDDPVMAMRIVNTLVRVIEDKNLARKCEEYTNAKKFIKDQLNIFKDKLANAAIDRRLYKEDNAIIHLNSTELNTINKVADLEAVKIEIEMKINQAEEFQRRLRDREDDQDSTIISASMVNDPISEELTSTLVKLEIKLKMQLVDLSEKHPHVISLRSEISETKRKIFEQIENKITSLRAELTELESIIQSYHKELQSLPKKELQLARLERNFRINEEIYTLLAKKYEETRISEAAVVSDIKPLDLATSPGIQVPYKSKKKQKLILGFFIGLGLGLALAFMLEYLDDSVKSIDEIEKELMLPVYGMIPFLKSVKLHKNPPGKSSTGNGKYLKNENNLLIQFAPKSVVSEAYRTLRTNIQFANIDQKLKTILVSSTEASEGKSINVSNLAISMAQLDKRILLVDTDLRRPTIYTLFNLNKDKGLIDILAGKKSWKDVIKSTKIENLNILTSGVLPPNPSELLNSERFAKLIEELKAEYDLILFDSPPIQPVSDAMVLGSKLDGVLLVIESGRTNKKAVMRIKTLLENVNANLIGVIYNKIKPRHGYDYYYYHNYYYYSGTKDKKRHSPIRKKLFN